MGTGSRALPGLGARWGVGLLALLIAAVMVSLAAGAYPVPLRDIPEVLLHAVFPGVFQAAPDPTAETVVIGLRLPRTVLAAIAGAGLAVSGAAFQTLFRNPLATPDTLGVATRGVLRRGARDTPRVVGTRDSDALVPLRDRGGGTCDLGVPGSGIQSDSHADPLRHRGERAFLSARSADPNSRRIRSLFFPRSRSG